VDGQYTDLLINLFPVTVVCGQQISISGDHLSCQLPLQHYKIGEFWGRERESTALFTDGGGQNRF
jgi:hypothetical protein